MNDLKYHNQALKKSRCDKNNV